MVPVHWRMTGSVVTVLAGGECEAALDSNPRSTGEHFLLMDRLRSDDPNTHSTNRDDAEYGTGVWRGICGCRFLHRFRELGSLERHRSGSKSVSWSKPAGQKQQGLHAHKFHPLSWDTNPPGNVPSEPVRSTHMSQRECETRWSNPKQNASPGAAQ